VRENLMTLVWATVAYATFIIVIALVLVYFDLCPEHMGNEVPALHIAGPEDRARPPFIYPADF
jgi:hypothetical protein